MLARLPALRTVAVRSGWDTLNLPATLRDNEDTGYDRLVALARALVSSGNMLMKSARRVIWKIST